jgi:hypothetical protein
MLPKSIIIHMILVEQLVLDMVLEYFTIEFLL